MRLSQAMPLVLAGLIAVLAAVFVGTLIAVAFRGSDTDSPDRAGTAAAVTTATPAVAGAVIAPELAASTVEPATAATAAPPAATVTPAVEATPVATSEASQAASAPPNQAQAPPAATTAPPGPAQPAAPAAPAPPPNFKVAFLGDQGLGSSSQAVLSLVKNEGAGMLLILGDFDYDDNPAAWDAMLNQSLGPDFPVFAVVGNHDESRWPQYRARLTDRLSRTAGASCSGDYGVNAACRYQGLFFVLSGAGTLGSGHAGFIREQLAADASVWSVCAWHKNQTALQLGDKDNDVGWVTYEQCRLGGAIIATAHEHSYQRTRTLANMQSQTIDPAWGAPDQLRVGGGSSFVFVSGLGGRSIRDQERCKPASPPYGCSGIWASVYSEDQRADYGALFIDFHVDGDPRKARGYFKNIRGQVVDSFTVVSEAQ